jgi:hypothetical protein
MVSWGILQVCVFTNRVLTTDPVQYFFSQIHGFGDQSPGLIRDAISLGNVRGEIPLFYFIKSIA